MTNEEGIKWIESLTADIGNTRHQDLWFYEQALAEISQMLAERKGGEWKRTVTAYPYCSACDWLPEEDEMTHGLYNFCPNCGADMRGENEQQE